ncbi:MAG: hypothetical protein M1833_004650 [Piccolia ochrophora]|nr:MAG: hypothetical protein M1833_004650 [Piccolia ochrophora]
MRLSLRKIRSSWRSFRTRFSRSRYVGSSSTEALLEAGKDAFAAPGHDEAHLSPQLAQGSTSPDDFEELGALMNRGGSIPTGSSLPRPSAPPVLSLPTSLRPGAPVLTRSRHPMGSKRIVSAKGDLNARSRQQLDNGVGMSTPTKPWKPRPFPPGSVVEPFRSSEAPAGLVSSRGSTDALVRSASIRGGPEMDQLDGIPKSFCARVDIGTFVPRYVVCGPTALKPDNLVADRSLGSSPLEQVINAGQLGSGQEDMIIIPYKTRYTTRDVSKPRHTSGLVPQSLVQRRGFELEPILTNLIALSPSLPSSDACADIMEELEAHRVAPRAPGCSSNCSCIGKLTLWGEQNSPFDQNPCSFDRGTDELAFNTSLFPCQRAPSNLATSAGLTAFMPLTFANLQVFQDSDLDGTVSQSGILVDAEGYEPSDPFAWEPDCVSSVSSDHFSPSVERVLVPTWYSDSCGCAWDFERCEGCASRDKARFRRVDAAFQDSQPGLRTMWAAGSNWSRSSSRSWSTCSTEADIWETISLNSPVTKHLQECPS